MFEEDEEKDLLKYRAIRNKMLPLTMEVTRQLFNQHRTDITHEKVLQYVRLISKYKVKKGSEDKSEKIAKSIVDFLDKNGIIESDEGYEDRYYFTTFGNNYMYYFAIGRI